MNCPVCSNQKLRCEIFSGIEIDRCPKCRGIWLDMLELEKLLRIDAKELVESDRSDSQSRTEDEPRLNCPKCKRTYLIKINSLVRRGVIVDSCTVCFGNWFDAGEFAQLAVGRGSRRAEV